MKRLIPAFAILIVIIIICAVGNILIKESIRESENEITECESLYRKGKIREAYEASLSFEKHWKKTSAFISAYSNHCPLDSISTLAAILPEAVKYQNDFEVDSTINQIKSGLHYILSEQSLNIQSLY